MNLEYRNLLSDDFDPASRVWVYQASRLFSLSEALEIEDMLRDFISKWNSHGEPVKGAAHLFFGQFVVLIADETRTGVGGCSTDSSVRLIREIETRTGANMFDRTTLAFVMNDKVQLLPMTQLKYAAENGFISGDTLYFNNLVQNQKELKEKWIIPVKNSWLQKRLAIGEPEG